MKKKKNKVKAGQKAKRSGKLKTGNSPQNLLSFYEEFAQLKKSFIHLTDGAEELEERVQDIEIHVNLLTRLFTTICVEKLGIRVGVLKRLIKRVEKEVIRDSQISHLESLYKLPHPPDKKSSQGNPPSGHSKNDPWEEIS